jgi:hypothetical protein
MEAVPGCPLCQGFGFCRWRSRSQSPAKGVFPVLHATPTLPILAAAPHPRSLSRARRRATAGDLVGVLRRPAPCKTRRQVPQILVPRFLPTNRLIGIGVQPCNVYLEIL